MSPLDGQVALVTGASRGIGAAVARALATAGVRLGLASRSGDRQAERRESAKLVELQPLQTQAHASMRRHAVGRHSGSAGRHAGPVGGLSSCITGCLAPVMAPVPDTCRSPSLLVRDRARGQCCGSTSIDLVSQDACCGADRQAAPNRVGSLVQCGSCGRVCDREGGEGARPRE